MKRSGSRTRATNSGSELSVRRSHLATALSSPRPSASSGLASGSRTLIPFSNSVSSYSGPGGGVAANRHVSVHSGHRLTPSRSTSSTYGTDAGHGRALSITEQARLGMLSSRSDSVIHGTAHLSESRIAGHRTSGHALDAPMSIQITPVSSTMESMFESRGSRNQRVPGRARSGEGSGLNLERQLDDSYLNRARRRSGSQVRLTRRSSSRSTSDREDSIPQQEVVEVDAHGTPSREGRIYSPTRSVTLHGPSQPKRESQRQSSSLIAVHSPFPRIMLNGVHSSRQVHDARSAASSERTSSTLENTGIKEAMASAFKTEFESWKRCGSLFDKSKTSNMGMGVTSAADSVVERQEHKVVATSREDMSGFLRLPSSGSSTITTAESAKVRSQLLTGTTTAIQEISPPGAAVLEVSTAVQPPLAHQISLFSDSAPGASTKTAPAPMLIPAPLGKEDFLQPMNQQPLFQTNLISGTHLTMTKKVNVRWKTNEPVHQLLFERVEGSNYQTTGDNTQHNRLPSRGIKSDYQKLQVTSSETTQAAVEIPSVIELPPLRHQVLSTEDASIDKENEVEEKPESRTAGALTPLPELSQIGSTPKASLEDIRSSENERSLSKATNQNDAFNWPSFDIMGNRSTRLGEAAALFEELSEVIEPSHRPIQLEFPDNRDITDSESHTEDQESGYEEPSGRIYELSTQERTAPARASESITKSRIGPIKYVAEQEPEVVVTIKGPPHMDSRLLKYTPDEYILAQIVREVEKKIEASSRYHYAPLPDDVLAVRSSKGIESLGQLRYETYDEDLLMRHSEDDLTQELERSTTKVSATTIKQHRVGIDQGGYAGVLQVYYASTEKETLEPKVTELPALKRTLQPKVTELPTGKITWEPKVTELPALKQTLEPRATELPAEEQIPELKVTELSAEKQTQKLKVTQLTVEKQMLQPKATELAAEKQTSELKVSELAINKETSQLKVAELPANKETPQLKVTELPAEKQTPELKVTQLPAEEEIPELKVMEQPAEKQTRQLKVTELPAEKQTPRSKVTKVLPEKQPPEVKENEQPDEKQTALPKVTELPSEKQMQLSKVTKVAPEKQPLELKVTELPAEKRARDLKVTELPDEKETALPKELRVTGVPDAKQTALPKVTELPAEKQIPLSKVTKAPPEKQTLELKVTELPAEKRARDLKVTELPDEKETALPKELRVTGVPDAKQTALPKVTELPAEKQIPLSKVTKAPPEKQTLELKVTELPAEKRARDLKVTELPDEKETALPKVIELPAEKQIAQSKVTEVLPEKQPQELKVTELPAEQHTQELRVTGVPDAKQTALPKVTELPAEKQIPLSKVTKAPPEKQTLELKVTELPAEKRARDLKVTELPDEKETALPKVTELPAEKQIAQSKVTEVLPEKQPQELKVTELPAEQHTQELRVTGVPDAKQTALPKVTELPAEKQIPLSKVTKAPPEKQTLELKVTELPAEKRARDLKVTELPDEKETALPKVTELPAEKQIAQSKVTEVLPEKQPLELKVTELPAEQHTQELRVTGVPDAKQTALPKVTELPAEKQVTLSKVTKVPPEKQTLELKVTELPAEKHTRELKVTDLPEEKQTALPKVIELPAEKQIPLLKVTKVAPEKQPLELKVTELPAEKQTLELRVTELPAEKQRPQPKVTELPAEKQTTELKVTELPDEKPTPELKVTELPAEKQTAVPKVTELPADKQTLLSEVSKLSAEKHTPLPNVAELPAEKPTSQLKVTELPAEKSTSQSKLTELPTDKQTTLPNVTEMPAEKLDSLPKVTELPAEKQTLEPEVTDVCVPVIDQEGYAGVLEEFYESAEKRTPEREPEEPFDAGAPPSVDADEEAKPVVPDLTHAAKTETQEKKHVIAEEHEQRKGEYAEKKEAEDKRFHAARSLDVIREERRRQFEQRWREVPVEKGTEESAATVKDKEAHQMPERATFTVAQVESAETREKVFTKKPSSENVVRRLIAAAIEEAAKREEAAKSVKRFREFPCSASTEDDSKKLCTEFIRHFCK
ncbi:hypothetical protein MTO96_000347 [Rhipicephalus appendiculatus]